MLRKYRLYYYRLSPGKRVAALLPVNGLYWLLAGLAAEGFLLPEESSWTYRLIRAAFMTVFMFPVFHAKLLDELFFNGNAENTGNSRH